MLSGLNPHPPQCPYFAFIFEEYFHCTENGLGGGDGNDFERPSRRLQLPCFSGKAQSPCGSWSLDTLPSPVALGVYLSGVLLGCNLCLWLAICFVSLRELAIIPSHLACVPFSFPSPGVPSACMCACQDFRSPLGLFAPIVAPVHPLPGCSQVFLRTFWAGSVLLIPLCSYRLPILLLLAVPVLC